jgi:hypothetical protein
MKTYALALVLAAAVGAFAALAPHRAVADEDACSSMSFYLQLADEDLSSYSVYDGYDKPKIPEADKSEFAHELGLADGYRRSCTYPSTLASYDVRRGLLVLRAAKVGVMSPEDAVHQSYAGLADAICQNRGVYDPKTMGALKHAVVQASRAAGLTFIMPQGCG